MFETLRELWTQGKDIGVGFLAKHQLNKKIEPYGSMLRLNIDSQKKSVEMELMLKGETHPMIVKIEEYTLEENSAGLYITVKRISTSREWITVAAEQFLLNKRFAIPREYAAALKLVA
jgi:hypothetical protein